MRTTSVSVDASVPIHVVPANDPSLLAAVALAGIVSGLLVLLGMSAYARRRSRSYLLVVLALATLLARSGVAVLTIGGFMSYDVHHFLEHGLDFVMAGLVLAAVYYARGVERAAEVGDR
ncbi:DUF7471 family protein [Halegenticoccus tardaugens]|uniref:DUF7471 family protein n=1 Tax=Halegenticoccus tardaugens TaxID=2071624 RepID=UPI00100ACFA9|nr:hypothetical protein [Halegenticoccus tardaugens]